MSARKTPLKGYFQSWNSLVLGAALAAAYLLVGTGASFVVFSPRPAPSVVDHTTVPNPTRTTEVTESTESTSTSASSPGSSTTPDSGSYQRQQADNGLSVEIPGGWTPNRSPKGWFEADEPGSTRLVRYGTYPVTGDLVSRHTADEQQPGIATDYRRISRTVSSFRGSSAVDWEFEFRKNGEYRHAHVLYWGDTGTEYLLYVSGPAETWPESAPVYDHMVQSVEQ